jgi:hypothetical protein
MNDKYKGMNNKDFKEYCDAEGIEVDSKNVSKPTRAEYIAAIEKFESKHFKKVVDSEPEEVEEKIEEDDFSKEVEEVKSAVTVSAAQDKEEFKAEEPKKLTRSQKRRKQYNELMALKRVIITSNANNQTKTDGIERIAWGNRLLGHQVDNIVIGKPWHVREGALRNLRASMIRQPVQDDDSNTVKFEVVPAWNIQELEPLSKEEIEKIAKRQAIRNASIESLI